MNIKCLLFAIGVLVTVSVQAQINESDTLKFQFRASLGGNRQTGNVELLLIRGKIDILKWMGKDWAVKSQNNSLYQAFFSRKADNDIYSRNYLYYKPQNRFYLYAIAYVSTNFRRKIDRRYFAGAGATYQVLRRPGQVVKLAANVIYESTKFKTLTYNDAGYDGDGSIEVWRSTAYVSGVHSLFDRRLNLYYDGFWQPAFGDSKNYRSQFDVGVDLPVWKGFNFNILYTYTHENVVATGVRKDDGILSFGLSYQSKRR